MQMPAITEVQSQAAASHLQPSKQHLKPEKGEKKPSAHFHDGQTPHGHNTLLQDGWIINDALTEKGMMISID